MTGLGFIPMILVDGRDDHQLGTYLLNRFGPRPIMTVGLVIAAGGMVYLGRLHVGSGYVGGRAARPAHRRRSGSA